MGWFRTNMDGIERFQIEKMIVSISSMAIFAFAAAFSIWRSYVFGVVTNGVIFVAFYVTTVIMLVRLRNKLKKYI